MDAVGFFRWVAIRFAERADGSGHRLFHLVLALGICLTWFFNNDGSILTGTPIIAALLSRMRLSAWWSLYEQASFSRPWWAFPFPSCRRWELSPCSWRDGNGRS